jgi:DNA invertase Pin-like site-specific DNA recombinase
MYSWAITPSSGAIMKAATTCAAQYLRMSTDVQDLSLSVQGAAIDAYAQRQGLSIVATYEDEGRSGLDLKGRPGMRTLLADVGAGGCTFATVLVYDVSRWGRFQDTDASAYYEYHCRLHGVEVVYVRELFAEQPGPMAMLVKSLKRAMAAEYSRELAIKVRAGQDRALDLGFHMGSLPCIGLDRMAISKDPGRTRVLAPFERKGTQSEHIKWVLGPAHEVAAVRRIFDLYANTNITMGGLAHVLSQEGVTGRDGRPITERMITNVLDCEAFVGDFVWGRKDNPRSKQRVESDPLFRRTVGTVEPIIDRAVWDRVKAKRYWRRGTFRDRAEVLVDLKDALRRNPATSLIELPALKAGTRATLTKFFGSTQEAFRLAGRDYASARLRKIQRQQRGWGVMRALVSDLQDLFTREGIGWTRPLRQHRFILEEAVFVRVQLAWQLPHHNETLWYLSKHDFPYRCDYYLVARMREEGTAADFMLVDRSTYRHCPLWWWEHLSGVLQIQNSWELIARLRSLIAARASC